MPEINLNSFPEWTIPGRRCLLPGALGAGMTAAAEILRDAGHDVIGMDHRVGCVPDDRVECSSDDRVECSSDVRVECSSDRCDLGPFQALLPWNETPPDSDVCIVTPAVPANSPLLQNIRAAATPILTLPEFIADAFRDRQQICVAGTHGKSTTTAMLNHIFHEAGWNPGCFVGAHQLSVGYSGRLGSSPWAVIESCEFNRSFLNYSPSVVVLTGIERDHFDCFPDEQTEDAAFESFLQQMPDDGVLVYSPECRRSRTLASGSTGTHVTYAVTDTERSAMPTRHDVTVSEIRSEGFGSRSTVTCHGQPSSLVLSVPGRHNVCNAAAAIAAATAAGIDINTCCAALSNFAGLSRRFELRGEIRGVTLIDDYAHHPTAIRETLRAARNAFRDRRIIVAFEPHQIVRTQTLLPQFVDALSLADEIYVLPVYAARENPSTLDCCRLSGQLVKELNQRNCKAFLFANLDQIVSRTDHSARASDVFLTMGAGRINFIHDDITRRFQRDTAA